MNSNSDDEPVPRVGYRNPPKQFQFKRGQSGNPRGRPKRAPLDPAAILDESITVTLGGKKQRRTAFDITVRRLIKMALDEQNLGACSRLFRLAEKFGITASAAPGERSSVTRWRITNAAEYNAYAETFWSAKKEPGDDRNER